MKCLFPWLALALCAACTPAADNSFTNTGAQWQLLELDGAPPLDNTQVTLEFGADNRLQGSAGCNRYSGSYRINGSSLYVTALSTTRMACEEAVLAQEQRYTSALESAISVTDDGSRLVIGIEGNDNMLVYASGGAKPR